MINTTFDTNVLLAAPLHIVSKQPDNDRSFLKLSIINSYEVSLCTGMQVFDPETNTLYICNKLNDQNQPDWFEASVLTASDFTKIIDITGNTGDGIRYVGSLNSASDISNITEPQIGSLYSITSTFTIPASNSATGDALDVVSGNMVLLASVVTSNGESIPKFGTLLNFDFSNYVKYANVVTHEDDGHYGSVITSNSITISATAGKVLKNCSIIVRYPLSEDISLSAFTLQGVTASEALRDETDIYFLLAVENIFTSSFKFDVPVVQNDGSAFDIEGVTISVTDAGLKVALINPDGEIINSGKTIQELVGAPLTIITTPDTESLTYEELGIEKSAEIDGPIITFVGTESGSDENDACHITVAFTTTMTKTIAENFVSNFSKIYWRYGTEGVLTKVTVSEVTNNVYEGICIVGSTLYLLIIDLNLHKFICTSLIYNVQVSNNTETFVINSEIANYKLCAGMVIPQEQNSSIVFGTGSDTIYCMPYSLN